MTTNYALKSKPALQAIPFIDLKTQQSRIRPQIDAAIQRVLDHGMYAMGPEVFELEKALSDFCGAKNVISCSSGTDALALILRAKEIRPGDAVFVPSFTFVATAEVVTWFGATPVFVDVLPDTFNMDPDSLKQGIQAAKKNGLTPKGIIPVGLFGQPADYEPIEAIADENGLWVLDDTAQCFGATYKGRKCGTIGDATATSFFPAKPLGCYGDGGAIFTDNDEFAEILRSMRIHGQGINKYENVRIGITGRLDTIQAAILLEKLKIFPEELKQRQRVADTYNEALRDVVQVPDLLEGTTSIWAQYTVVLQGQDRDKVVANLKALGIPTAIYYPIPLHLQKAYDKFLRATDSLSVSESLSHKVLSLPMHPYLEESDQSRIIEGVRASL
ncbi:MAG: DegT/DnrJ/EryC1/StrS family aminotransferase [Alphaproteobacteria bacterium]|jgi:dTDP-4-amino-4,6-dideoxygalactose transaminase|nr:DegT/DnrJ/EryC1/StrS family aminotransferase [Alphaproteobacteria bacterium]MBT5389758.1 DegT/DnrJ/EryC1/StrS family aminotransferase [Alphaproteobacteria bacterium]MBT5540399.1 DegT/DnrJ/EryC1/StrS family aminotransferase [Alphaproteobacteria bacterium]MBT5655087.1 DegT/DnrJ/EryC1/StrS family aminotransferase [Alphaproteobacteria bacterium]